MLILLALALDTVPPPRDSGIAFSSPQSLIALQACVVRKMAHGGMPLLIPAVGGVEIDLSQRGFNGTAGEAPYSLHIREAGAYREVSVHYRHPYSAKVAFKITRDIAGRCFEPEFAVVKEP